MISLHIVSLLCSGEQSLPPMPGKETLLFSPSGNDADINTFVVCICLALHIEKRIILVIKVIATNDGAASHVLAMQQSSHAPSETATKGATVLDTNTSSSSVQAGMADKQYSSQST